MNIKWENRNEFIGKSRDLFLRRRKRSFRRAGYSNVATEYAYNANGAMTKDLNKGISDTQYNSLNLPRLIDIKSPVAEARNEYTYSASGQKLKVVQKWNPNFSTAPAIGSAINTATLTESKTTDYIGNMIYENGALKRILFGGGYVESGVYHYYLTDHLGNNRLVVNSSGTVVQKNHYYPFGTAFAETPVAEQGKQPYKFGSKELDPMSGLNWYDFSARFKDDLWFTTPDPLAELTPDISPYAFCNNNPLRYTDPTGMSTHTDSLGNIVAVYNDKDLRVYRHNTLPSSYATYEGETETYTDANGKTQTREKNRLSGGNGENMGETEYWDEFRGHNNKTGAITNQVGGRIIFGESWNPMIDALNGITSNSDLSATAMLSLPGNSLDIKRNRSIAEYGATTGRLLNGKYATAESAGNYLAGLNGATGKFMGMYISLETYMGLAGGVHAFQNNTNPNFAPYYGEIPYAGRRIVSGFNYGLKLRH